MNLLSWIFILELLLLFSAYVAWWAGKIAARERPDDALYKFTLVFWRTFRQKPLPLRAPVLDADDMDAGTGEDADLGDEFAEPQQRAGKHDATEHSPQAQGASTLIHQATLNVRVLAHSPRDQISGFDGKTLKIQVIASAEAGAANKAVIDLLTSTLGIKTHQLLLIRGHYQSQKTLQINGMDQDQLNERLESFA